MNCHVAGRGVPLTDLTAKFPSFYFLQVQKLFRLIVFIYCYNHADFD